MSELFILYDLYKQQQVLIDELTKTINDITILIKHNEGMTTKLLINMEHITKELNDKVLIVKTKWTSIY